MTHASRNDLGRNGASQPPGPRFPVHLAGWLVSCSLVLSGFLSGGLGHAQQPPAKPTGEKSEVPESVSKRRLEIMQAAIDSFTMDRGDLEADQQVETGDKPVLRYDDQARNLLDAGVWCIGKQGRPTAFITIELYGAGEDQALLTYEFISLSSKKFSMNSTNGPSWAPELTELVTRAVPDAPKPAESKAARLTQMRDIAREFNAVQTYRGQKIELRLLTQPIDRYSNEDRKIVDGSVFVFANGTNPEMGMLIETDGKIWTYGIFRMSTAPIAVEYAKKAVEGIPPNAAYGVSRAYTATRHSVTLPK